MKFDSKAHMAQELLAGKRFRNQRSGRDIYFDDTEEVPFRYGTIHTKAIWDDFDKDIWEEVESRHVHQDLIDTYQEGQAWQFKPIGRTLWENCRYRSGIWHKPDWREDAEYRLHPHNDLIQATKAGDPIQWFNPTSNTWVDLLQEPTWGENAQYRIKPPTKILYEWYVKTSVDGWFVHDALFTEEEITSKDWVIEYKKTGRSLEVEV